MTTLSVSPKTLSTIRQFLADGKPKTVKMLTANAKKKPATVYRALQVLEEEGAVESIRHGRSKLYFARLEDETREEKPSHAQNAVEARVARIQKSIQAVLEKKGRMPLKAIVEGFDYPRSSTYAAAAEMRRKGELDQDEEGNYYLTASPLLPVHVPPPVEGTATADLPPPPIEMLGSVVRSLTEAALIQALSPLLDSHPDVISDLFKKTKTA